jgi:hypothetical protein
MEKYPFNLKEEKPKSILPQKRFFQERNFMERSIKMKKLAYTIQMIDLKDLDTSALMISSIPLAKCWKNVKNLMKNQSLSFLVAFLQ